uniref:N-acetylglucosaminylphosphatidylinositol deacetylase n=1 Tax=Trichobilharzia regenti TaxID=157069 RepID=A0AA85JUW9_TRIRE|nr:unnamed protein product [Trichobilharzia regenti]
MWIITIIGYNILIFILWICFIVIAGRKTIKVKHPVLVVVAHPDDESMFFAPTILKLIYTGYHVDLLCVTTGNYDGLGDVRKLEMNSAARKLGIRRLSIIDSEGLKDGPASSWSEKELTDIISKTCCEFRSQSVISFDKLGAVSKCPNNYLHDDETMV